MSQEDKHSRINPSNFLETEVDRREFLLQSGKIMLAVVGLSGLAAIFRGNIQKAVDNTLSHRSTKGYGSGTYGHKKTNQKDDG